MPDLQAEIRDALTSSAAGQLCAGDLRRNNPPTGPPTRSHHTGAHRRWLVAACVAVVVALAATLSVYATGPGRTTVSSMRSSLVGFVWSITEVTHAGTTVQVPPQGSAGNFIRYAFYFLPDGRWGAAGQFTAYEGTYQLHGDELTIHDAAEQPAESGTNDATGTAAAAVLEAMKSGTGCRVRITGNRLVLEVGSDRLVATRPAATRSPIIGTTWRITEVQHGRDVAQMPTGPAASTPIPILTFSRDGTAQLADLGLFRVGRYTVTGSKLTIRDIQLHPPAHKTDAAMLLLNRALRELETPGVVANITVTGSRLVLVAGGYTFIGTRLATEPMPTPPPVFPSYEGNTPPGFVGYSWTIVAVAHAGKRIAIPASLHGGLTFTTDLQFAGNDGVNGQGGTYQLTPDGYVLWNVSSTLVGLNETTPARKALILGVRAIEQPNTDIKAHASGSTLTVSAGGYVVTALRGEAVRDLRDLEPVTDPAKLVGISWKLTGISEQPDQVGGRPTFQNPDTAGITLEFAGPAGGIRAVTSGCSTATASATKGRILFRTRWVTSPTPSCTALPQLGAAQRQFVLKTLSVKDLWSIVRGTLTIGRPGVGTLRFSR